MNTWNNAEVNQVALFIWEHKVSDVLTDVFQAVRVDLYNASPFQDTSLIPFSAIPTEQITHVGTGMYQFTFPEVADPGEYWARMVWITEDGGAHAYDYRSITVNLSGSIATYRTSPDYVLLLRQLLNDDNPDEDYHFSPPDFPTAAFTVRKHTKRAVWSDTQLDVCLYVAAQRLANTPPPTPGYNFSYFAQLQSWWLLQAAMIQALTMKSILWVHEEFDYNVSSLSMNINKHEKYRSLLSEMESTFYENYRAYKVQTQLHTRGLLHPSSTYGTAGRLAGSRASPTKSNLRRKF